MVTSSTAGDTALEDALETVETVDTGERVPGNTGEWGFGNMGEWGVQKHGGTGIGNMGEWGFGNIDDSEHGNGRMEMWEWGHG